jgi:hypothetical protein
MAKLAIKRAYVASFKHEARLQSFGRIFACGHRAREVGIAGVPTRSARGLRPR